MLNAKDYETKKYEVIEAYYDLYHKDDLCYPEAKDKNNYCAMMMKQVGINEIENMKKMSMRTVVDTESKVVEKKAMRLYKLICKLKERFYYNYEEMQEKIA